MTRCMVEGVSWESKQKSVPTVVGCGGVRQQVELELTQKERLGLQQSARVLRETIDQVEARVGKVRVATGPAAASNGGRTIPRAAWQVGKKN